jgi:hypothetical protein
MKNVLLMVMGIALAALVYTACGSKNDCERFDTWCKTCTADALVALQAYNECKSVTECQKAYDKCSAADHTIISKSLDCMEPQKCEASTLMNLISCNPTGLSDACSDLTPHF